MKSRPLLIALSLAANVVLAFFVANRSAGWMDFSSGPSAGKSAVKAASPAAPAAKVGATAKIDPEAWNAVTTGELRDVAARLQAEGFPASLQRAILAALIADKFADRHKALADLVSAQSWWSPFNSGGMSKVTAMRQQIYREEKDMLEALLGPDAGTSDYARARRTRSYGDLPAAKATELDRISADYNELIQEVRTASQNILLPEDREKIAFLEKEKRADIAKLLSPDELFEYDLRSSPSAGTLRYQLAAFNPTEEEYRALFKLRSEFDARFPSAELMTMEQRRDYGTAQAELAKQAQTVLSVDCYAEYQQKTDPVYVQTNALVTRLQLPATTTAELVAIQKDITKRADALRADRGLANDQRIAQLGALGAEASVRAGTIVGETNLPAYRQSAGAWITSLQRAAQPPTPAPRN